MPEYSAEQEAGLTVSNSSHNPTANWMYQGCTSNSLMIAVAASSLVVLGRICLAICLTVSNIKHAASAS